MRYFRPYLYGRHFTIRTDHGSLRWLLKFKDPEGQIARWIQILGEYDYAVIHRPGKSHQNAESLSRIQCPQCSMVLGGHRLGDGDKSDTPVAVMRKQEHLVFADKVTEQPEPRSVLKKGTGNSSTSKIKKSVSWKPDVELVEIF